MKKILALILSMAMTVLLSTSVIANDETTTFQRLTGISRREVTEITVNDRTAGKSNSEGKGTALVGSVYNALNRGSLTNIGSDYADGQENWECRIDITVGEQSLTYFIPGGMKYNGSVYVVDNEDYIKSILQDYWETSYKWEGTPDVYTDNGVVYYYFDEGDYIEVRRIDFKGKSSVTTVSSINGKPVKKLMTGMLDEGDNNTTLKSLTIGSGTEELDMGIIYNFKSLKEITLPDSITTLAGGGFYKCESLETVHLSDSLTVIPRSAFSGCTSLRTVNLPKRLARIEMTAFAYCENLKSVSFPQSLSSIEQNAFAESGLTEITIPTNVSAIGAGAFASTPLKKVTFEGNPSVIGKNAFKCENLAEINGLSDASLTKFFDAFDGTLFIKNYLTDNGKNPFIVSNGELKGYLGTDTDIVIPDTVKIIADEVFMGKEITRITIPSSVTRIGGAAFHGARIKELTIPASVEWIEQLAFANCKELEKLVIEGGKTTVDMHAFQNCEKLAYVTLAEGVTLKEGAFNNTPFENGDTSTPTPQTTLAPTETPTPTTELIVKSVNGILEITSNGIMIDFPDAQPFIDENGRTQIPVRAVTESLGAVVNWNGVEQSVAIIGNGTDISLTVGSDIMLANGKETKMDTVATIIDGRTYVPIRYVAEAMEMTVVWK